MNRDDLTKTPTSEVLRKYIHYCEALYRWEAKDPLGLGTQELRNKQELYAKEIDRRFPL
jgi:hypothetical protein